ncbi:type II secretion system protein [Phytohalomonas tamaricis]|uniref:type II secretion system protein n=1 Tax=Phytohalomonas tamaricis TaxID=2081032 RepID=UPI00131A0F1D|nr:type II secretion system protein [Phytohalomonas tamaricis]
MTFHAQKGFTLLEMLAAIVLLAVTFFVVMDGIGQASHALIKDSRATRMALTARSLLDASVHSPLQSGTQKGRLENSMQWQLVITKTGIPTRIQLYRLDLTLVSDGHREHFSTLRAQYLAETAP